MADIQLAAFLRRAAARPFAWGEFDCCLFFADWLVELAGVDPAAELRGRYSTEREMRRLVKAAGGLVRLVDECMAGVGWRQTAAPQRGDIGLVRVGLKAWRGRLVMVPTGAIAVSDELWAIKTAEPGRVTVARFPLVQAWGHEWPKRSGR